MRVLPLLFVAAPAFAHPGTIDHDTGWFSVVFGLVLIAASIIVLVRSQ
ncbi:MAG: hypothetical protein AAGM84_17205 [Pseudomonadota bacterium]